MNVYAILSLYSTITNFGNVDVSLSKHRKVMRVENAPREVDRVAKERHLYIHSSKIYKLHC